MFSLIHKTLAALTASLMLVSAPISVPDPEADATVQLVLEARGPGTLSWDGQGPGVHEVPAGTEVVLEIRPDAGARLARLERDGKPVSTGGKDTLEFVPVADTAITAVFEEAPDPVGARPFELTEEESAAIDAWRAGDAAAGLPVRKALCERYGLQDEVDERYFLKPAWFQEHGMYGAVFAGLQVLNPDPDGMVLRSRSRAAGTVVAAKIHDWYYPGGFMNGGVWTISVPGFGEVPSFCANGMYAPPAAGTPVQEPALTDNAMLRKALYYGYNGPDNRMNSRGWNEAQQVIFTNDLVSMAMTGTAIGAQIGGGWIWRDYGQGFWNEMKGWPEPPATFFCYVAQTQGQGTNWQGVSAPYQPLAFYLNDPKGTFRLVKKDRLPELTAGNGAYSLANAEYTLYDSGGREAARLVTKADGSTDPVTLRFGTYTLKETRAPAGYQLDPGTYTVNIGPSGNGNVRQLDVTDIPESLQPELLVKKTGRGGKPLAGARFEVKFTPAGQDKPARTWILASDKDGIVRLDEAHKVSGDAFYLGQNGQPVLPKGTLTIRESQAPDGYRPDGQTRVFDTSSMTVWKAPEIANEPNDLVLSKKQAGTDAMIPGTVFVRTGPDGSQEEQKTDENGRLVFANLLTGRHEIREKSPAPGYAGTEEVLLVDVTDTGILVNGRPLKADGHDVTNAPAPHPATLIKKSSDGRLLAGARFTLYADEAGSQPLWSGTTAEDGRLSLPDLEDGREYWLQETEAPAGYRPDPAMVRICMNAVPAAGQGSLELDGTEYKAGTETDAVTVTMEDGVLSAEFVRVNRTGALLPETGSKAGLQLLAVALLLLAGSMILKRKEKK